MASLDSGPLLTGESELRGDTKRCRPVFPGYAALKLLDLIWFWLHGHIYASGHYRLQAVPAERRVSQRDAGPDPTSPRRLLRPGAALLVTQSSASRSNNAAYASSSSWVGGQALHHGRDRPSLIHDGRGAGEQVILAGLHASSRRVTHLPSVRSWITIPKLSADDCAGLLGRSFSRFRWKGE